MLVGGVEEEESTLDEASTVIALSTESEEEARMTSVREVVRGVVAILSRRAVNMLSRCHDAFMNLLLT
jgi:hypothetical protein